jgi:uncharacterized RDD family membrane protein YckC
LGEVDPLPTWQPAPRGARLLAHLVDLLVQSALLLRLAILLTLVVPQASDTLTHAAMLALGAAYYVLLWGLAGTSPGKRLFRLRVIGPNGREPGIQRALIRYTVMFFVGVPLGLTWWPVLVRPDRRALHDLAAGTRVVAPVQHRTKSS